MNKNIFPIFESGLNKTQMELLLNQKAKVLWFTGLSGSGKSTIAQGLAKKMYKSGYVVKLLDGDNIRTGINNNLGFSLEDRNENIRRIAEVAKLFIDCGIIVLCSFVSPTKKIRGMAKSIIGREYYNEIYIDTSLEICEKRDVKGLYKKARQGKIQNFTGISSPYEIPDNPDMTITTVNKSVNDCIQKCFMLINK